MRIHWGVGIVIAFIAFIGFILFFVIRMSTDTNYRHDLVTTDYYSKELTYQQHIDAAKNVQKLKEKIQIERVNDGITIYFPSNLDSLPNHRFLGFELIVGEPKRINPRHR